LLKTNSVSSWLVIFHTLSSSSSSMTFSSSTV
jgi:hypothetical protein